MTPIQVLLIAAALLWSIRYLVKLRLESGMRLLALVAVAGAVLLVAFPQLSVRLAHAFGVTRGVDFAFYIAFVALGFLWLHQAARIRQLETRLADLARVVALRELSAGEAPADSGASGSAEHERPSGR